jgi:hypothetical protein
MGIAGFDVKNNYSFTQHALPNDYYGLWCGGNPGELITVMSQRPNEVKFPRVSRIPPPCTR